MHQLLMHQNKTNGTSWNFVV